MFGWGSFLGVVATTLIPSVTLIIIRMRMNLLLLLLLFDTTSSQQYNKHITPPDFEVPHERKLFLNIMYFECPFLVFVHRSYFYQQVFQIKSFCYSPKLPTISIETKAT